jgi:cell division protein ZapA (FtsZ GTPase activity inhibitor)
VASKRAVAVGVAAGVPHPSDDDGRLQRVAGYLDETMATVEERTGTVDSHDVALLTALNLARELVEIRERGPAAKTLDATAERLQHLIEIAESALGPEAG